MAKGKTDGYEDLITCPYNPAHRILMHRFQTHLVKCRKVSGKDSKLMICPYNSTHHIREPELAHHVQDCPDKASLDHYKYTMDTGGAKLFEEPRKETFDEIPCEDNWDDYDVPTYKPGTHIESNGIIQTRAFIGKTPSEKKKIREAELLRLHKLT